MITIKTDKEIEILRAGGRILAQILDKLAAEAKPGITTGDLEAFALELMRPAGGRPSFKGYKTRHDIKPFPTAICASINDEIVHAPALPARKLNSGDIIGIDLGMEYPAYAKTSAGKPFYRKQKNEPGVHGFYTDAAVTVAVGKVNKIAKKLINATKKSLELGIERIKPGNTLNDIGRAIESYTSTQGFSVVRDLVGHGVGYDVHEDPQIPNYPTDDKGFDNIVLKKGMVLAIEPMVNIGSDRITVGSDGFTVRTFDGGLSAHFEHTVAVTEDGCIVLTGL